ncbi:unnamed protein product [Brugia timori]|uniref:Uncharacterized protein n=1 Tax=Brugia timori TaxID=42155 RepID=A0A0R3R8M0_9BILA|nr:unnamed protein product [Brugia timori]
MSVFKRGGGGTKSGRTTTTRKSSGLKSDLKSAFENGIAKRISSSSDRSFDCNSNENSSTSRSTFDFTRFEHTLKSVSSSSLQITEDDATIKSVKPVESISTSDSLILKLYHLRYLRDVRKDHFWFLSISIPFHFRWKLLITTYKLEHLLQLDSGRIDFFFFFFVILSLYTNFRF